MEPVIESLVELVREPYVSNKRRLPCSTETIHSSSVVCRRKYSDNSTTFIGTKGELEFSQALATNEWLHLISV